MSRVIVKNLPLKADEQQIRDHFASKGDITDVKLMRKRDGSSRRFAFVGFKSDAQAQQAAQFFNDSFMNTSKLEVQLAKVLNDDSLISQSSRRKRKHEILEREKLQASGKSQKRNHDDLATDTKSAKLAEYLEVMKPKSATASWKNDESQNVKSQPPSSKPDDDDEDMVDLGRRQNDDDEEFERELRKIREENPGSNNVSNRPSSLDTDDNEDEDNDENNIEDDGDRKTFDDAEEKEVDESVTDLDWLRSRQTRIRENGEKPETAPTNVSEETSDPVEVAPAEKTATDLISESGRLFLRNLSYSVTEDDLRDLFSKFGILKELHVPIDPRTDKPKGFAFVLFNDSNDAITAYEELDGSIFQGRLLHILAAQTPSEHKLDEFDLKNMSLKKQREISRKSNASRSQFSWNSLYLNQDTVLETVAARLGVTKSEMMDPHSSNMAVKQALAESTVLQSVQQYFKSKGVDLAKFQGKETSDKILLVKNLPFNVHLQEISDLFSQYGKIVRILMPPEGGIAIVEYETGSSGKAAFSKVAFRRIGNSIIYLQKAPKGIFTDEISGSTEEINTVATSNDIAKEARSAKDLLLGSGGATTTDGTSALHASIFVKNLNFSTDVRGLTNLFKTLDGFVTAQIKTKPDSNNPGKQLSMGFGFVEFKTLGQAETAIAALQDYNLDGHKLQLRVSTRGEDQKAAAKPKGTAGTKIIIKNVPFETSKKDITDLFGTFGQLRTVRLPRKFNKKTRGFAFAEFATVKEAEHAMESLQGAHLLGRRLVMEYAQEDAEDPEQEIARMEAKVRGQVDAEDLAGMRLNGQRKAFDMEEDDGDF